MFSFSHWLRPTESPPPPRRAASRQTVPASDDGAVPDAVQMAQDAADTSVQLARCIADLGMDPSADLKAQRDKIKRLNDQLVAQVRTQFNLS